MEQLAQALLMWISINTSYSITGVPVPNIKIVTAKEITKEFYSGQEYLIPTGGVDDRIFALYDALTETNGIVYLRVDSASRNESMEDMWEDPVMQERLLHELIHHVQFQTGAAEEFLCQIYGEKEAYLLGGRFLKQQYVDDPMPNRNFWAHFYSRC